MTEKMSIRMSGLGGQGVVTAAHILGMAAYKDDLQVTVNPFFGAEKRLAPAESYVRIAQEPIYERGEILYPSLIMVFHPHVITMGKSYTMPFFDGLEAGGTILINSASALDLSEEERDNLAKLDAQVHYVPASEVAMEVSGTHLSTNIAMLGALYRIQQRPSLDALESAMVERFGGSKFVASGSTAALDDAVKEKFAKVSQMIEKNLEVIEKAGESMFQQTH
ncbi:2-oxoacid:acceptor oxidoreductase family protein [Halochromatium roseum]|uniref:2-oxoacid:acceptor oxidoreductase family protein n=1 Tax=Halochromatium roseum TaxID=391920 RepID=UPI00191326E5|nr:2-oxoacid:acceptor oxidoreductase family protein [Halochromatium roseum]MBK5938387.1 ferredoxin oxidoreductase [Halochromatium roseum]